MQTQLVIKGAYYFCQDRILMAHFTGMFFCVDCSDFRTKEDIKQEYDKETACRIIKENMSIEYDGTVYYETGDYSPYYVENMVLLSDLSELSFTEEEFNF